MIFLFDGTNSVSQTQMYAMKSLLHNLILGYNTASPSIPTATTTLSTRIGLGVYGHSSLRGNGYFTNQLLSDKMDLVNYLSGMKKVGGTRRLGAALDFSISRFGGLQQLVGSRKKVFVTFTTGRNQISDMPQFLNTAQRIQGAGHEMYVVAIGNRIDIAQYVNVVGAGNVYHAINVNALPDFLHRLLILNMPIEGKRYHFVYICFYLVWWDLLYKIHLYMEWLINNYRTNTQTQFFLKIGNQ